MPRYVALLRGINVGRRSLKMDRLRGLVEAAGGEAVRTYIQSGNVVLTHRSRSAAALERELEERIESDTGMVVPVMLRTRRQWDRIVADTPFPTDDPKKLHVVLFARRLESPLPDLDPEEFLPERLAVAERHLYLYLPNGMGPAQLPVALDRKGPKDNRGTARNWATVLALQERLGSVGG